MPAKLARRTPNRPQTLNMSVTIDLAGGEVDEDDQDDQDDLGGEDDLDNQDHEDDLDDEDNENNQDEGAFVVIRAFEVI